LYILAGSVLSSCNNYERVESVHYFNKLTGLNLCQSAIVKNKNYDQFDYQKDSNYSVYLTINEECYQELKNQIAAVGKLDCKMDKCIAVDRKQNYYLLSRFNAQKTVFTLKFSS
jgi:hypothetical protein